MKLTAGREKYKLYKKGKIQKAKSIANMVIGAIARNSNKLLIGQTFWKNVIILKN